MSGNVWMFSDEIDDEDLEFMRHDYVTYNMACEYYRLGIKPVVRMAHEAGAVYKIGKKVLIRRSIFEAYMSQHRHDTDIQELKTYFTSVIDWISGVFSDVESEMRGIEWGRLFETYHNQPYDPVEAGSGT